jgi:hypothetical protein
MTAPLDPQEPRAAAGPAGPAAESAAPIGPAPIGPAPASPAPIPPTDAEGGLPAPQPPRPADPATTAALDEVVAARRALADELVTLEASLRAAVDIKAKVRRNPGKTAAAVGGTAFLVLGGPRRTFRAIKHRIVGKPDPLPPSLLPEQVDEAVRALGDDGAKVRGALEREFAAFVREGARADRRFRRQLLYATAAPLATTALREILKRLTAASADDVAAREAAIRERVEGRTKQPPGA